MPTRAEKLVAKLAVKCERLRSPIHVIAVCSGGRTVGRLIFKHLRAKKIPASYHEVWTNIVGGRAKIWKSSFGKKDYVGTALIAEDVIWFGRSVNAARAMLRSMRKGKVYTAVLLDFNRKADFSVFS
ncbi:MAG TPA: hypothetical protein VJJ47_03310 [Candidatus Paceibacterota bacterium]